MNDSDGISLADSLNAREYQCAAYGGPWVAWSVIRDNSMGGISLAARNGSATAGHGASCILVFGSIHGEGPGWRKSVDWQGIPANAKQSK